MKGASEFLLKKFLREWGPLVRKDEPIAGSSAVEFLGEFTREAKAALKLDAAEGELVRTSDREIATMLSALRFWQRHQYEAIKFAPEYFDDHEPLKEHEVDRLCWRINR